MLKFQVILVMIFLGALLTGFFFWIKISQYPKMPPLSKLCLEGISVEVCPSGDYLVGRENMKKDIWYIFCSIMLVILTIGLCGLKNWARIGIIIWSIVILLSTPLKYLPTLIFTLFFCAFVLFYLTRPKVKEQFK